MTSADRPDLDPGVRAWMAEALAAPAGAPVEVVRDVSGRNQAVLRSRLAPQLLETEMVDRQVDSPGGPITVRVYTPRRTDARTPLFVHCHGGGWVLGSIDSHVALCQRISVQAGAVVVSIGYRLAPEYRFPAAFDDCLAVTEWAMEHAGELGADADLVAVGGESAGGQLAASVALAARDRGLPLAGQVLLYPVTKVDGHYADDATNAGFASRATQALGPGLTLAGMTYFANEYVDIGDAGDWRVSPLNADLAGVAPAVVHTAGCDVLCDEGNQYAGALRQVGVRVIAREFPTLPHSYFPMGGVSAAAELAATQAAADLRDILGLPLLPALDS